MIASSFSVWSLAPTHSVDTFVFVRSRSLQKYNRRRAYLHTIENTLEPFKRGAAESRNCTSVMLFQIAVSAHASIPRKHDDSNCGREKLG